MWPAQPVSWRWWSLPHGCSSLAGGWLLVAGRRLGGRLLTLVLLALLSVMAVGLVVQMVGNQRVAASIWQTSYGDGQAGLVGPAYPGFESGHIVVGRGDWLVWLGGLAITILLGLLGRVPPGVAVTSVVLSLLPPWMLPGLGVVFVLAYMLARGSRRVTTADAHTVLASGGRSTRPRRVL
jgi:hypothetical protein